MKPNLKRVGRACIVSMIVCLTLFASTAIAEASAEGYTPFGIRHVAGKTFPTGFLDHTTDGSGHTVTGESALWESALPLCNWHIDFNFIDAGGQYYYVQGQNNGGPCNVGGSISWTPPGGKFRARTGRVCAVLYRDLTVRVVMGCNSIHG